MLRFPFRLEWIFICGFLMPLSAVADEIPRAGILLKNREAYATPEKSGRAGTAGGNIHVNQPSADTVVIKMSGAAVANGHPFKSSHASINFELNQEFKVVFANSQESKNAKLYLDIKLIGLLRGGNKHGSCGTAGHSEIAVAVSAGPAILGSLSLPPLKTVPGQNTAINCRKGPLEIPVSCGCFTVHASLRVDANHSQTFLDCQPVVADFNPGGVKVRLHHDPFSNCSHDDFGLQITVRVVTE